MDLTQNQNNGTATSSCWGASDGAGQHNESNTENCQVCGSQLEYFNSGRELTCVQCGKNEMGNISCPNGHYVCDECHGKGLLDTVKEYVLNSKSANPFEIAEYLMDQNNVPMLGCENAWIASGALMAALKNEGTIKVTDEQIIEALTRTKRQAIGGYCGLTGVCGIVPAIGACFSVILGAACPKDQETEMTMKVVARIVDKIADETGPCCCKNFVRTALSEAIQFVEMYFNVSLPSPSEAIVCTHSSRHPHGCRKSKCSYYKMNETPQTLQMAIVGENIKKPSLSPFDKLVKKAVELGIEEVKVIDTRTISVAEWVQWKCQYGCPFYDKGAFHPPLAPKAEETKRVIKEYDKALLLTGPNGPDLSQQAIKIEHAAYSLGYYKAFALLALPYGAAPSWQKDTNVAQDESPASPKRNQEVRPLMEACGIDVFKTARNNGFHIDTQKETYGKWNYFALVLLE